MHILDSLRNVLDFSNKKIIDAIRDRKEIQTSIEGIDYIADNEDVLLQSEKKEFVGKKLANLNRNISNYDNNVKKVVKAQVSEIDKLALEFIRQHEIREQIQQANNLNTASTRYGNKIIDEVNHDWGQERLLARIDKSLEYENKNKGRTEQYTQARNELNNALHIREARLILAANNTDEIKNELKTLNKLTSIAQNTQTNKTYKVTGSHIMTAYKDQYALLKKEYNTNKTRIDMLNNSVVITNEAKNNLTNGEYKDLLKSKRAHVSDSSEYKTIVEKIAKIDAYYSQPENIDKFNNEKTTVKSKFSQIASQLEAKQTSISTAIKDIKTEVVKLSGIENNTFTIKTLKISQLKTDTTFQQQVAKLQPLNRSM